MLKYVDFALDVEKMGEEINSDEVKNEEFICAYQENIALQNTIENISGEGYIVFLKNALLKKAKSSKFEVVSLPAPDFKCERKLIFFDISTQDGERKDMAGEFYFNDFKTLSDRVLHTDFAEVNNDIFAPDTITSHPVEKAVQEYYTEVCEQRWQDLNKGCLKPWSFYLQNIDHEQE